MTLVTGTWRPPKEIARENRDLFAPAGRVCPEFLAENRA